MCIRDRIFTALPAQALGAYLILRLCGQSSENYAEMCIRDRRNSAILWSVKEAFRADMVTLRWEGNTPLFKSFVAGWKNSLRCV